MLIKDFVLRYLGWMAKFNENATGEPGVGNSQGIISGYSVFSHRRNDVLIDIGHKAIIPAYLGVINLIKQGEDPDPNCIWVSREHILSLDPPPISNQTKDTIKNIDHLVHDIEQMHKRRDVIEALRRYDKLLADVEHYLTDAQWEEYKAKLRRAIRV